MTHALGVADTSVLLACFDRRDKHHASGVHAFAQVGIKIVSPLVLAELDHMLLERVGEHAALDAVSRVRALAGVGYVRLPPVDASLLGEAEQLLGQYRGQELGLTDAVNACLAWRLPDPIVLSFDGHYAHTLAPRHRGEPRLNVLPGPATG